MSTFQESILRYIRSKRQPGNFRKFCDLAFLLSVWFFFFPPKIQEVSSCKTWNSVQDTSSILFKLQFLLVQTLCSLNRHTLFLNDLLLLVKTCPLVCVLCGFVILDILSSFICFSDCHISRWVYRMELCCIKACKKGLLSYQASENPELLFVRC